MGQGQSPYWQPIQAPAQNRREVSELDTYILRPADADIDALQTQPLRSPEERPPGASPVLRPPPGDPPTKGSQRRLLGPEAYEHEADQLRAQAAHLEQQLWDLGEHQRQARARYEQVRAAPSAPEAQAGELAQLSQTIVRLVSEMASVRETYVGLLSEASHYHLAAQLLRDGERG